MNDLHIALWQTPHPASTAEALQRLDAACAQARAQGAELLITPEMFLTGYAIGLERVAALAEPADGPLAQAVAGIAQRHGIAVVYGYPELNPHGRPFNAAQAAAWHLNNDVSWAELAAKQQGTERSLVRPPYFSRFEIQAGMAYANVAAQRGQLAQMQRQLAGEANAPVAAGSEALSTAPDADAGIPDAAPATAPDTAAPPAATEPPPEAGDGGPSTPR